MPASIRHLRIFQALGRSHSVTYTREFVPRVNDAELAGAVLDATAPISEAAVEAKEPWTASEDFAQFLAHVPGCFAYIGNGEKSAPLHNPGFDFNDAALSHGAAVYVAIARSRLQEG